MRERSEQQHGTVIGRECITLGNARGCVEHMHGVDTDVAFGVPLGVLRHAEQFFNFREVRDPAGGSQIFADAAGAGALHGPLHELFGDAFTGEGRVFSCNGARHRRGGGVHCEVEAAGELHPAQHTQWIFRKGIASGAKDAMIQIHLAAEKVPHVAGERVEAHGVDGEVATRGGLARSDRCVELSVEIAVAGTGLAIAARNAKVAGVIFMRGKLHHAEALAHQVDATARGEKLREMVVRNAVHFEVEVLGWQAQESIAYRSAYHHGVMAGRAQLAYDLLQRKW